MTKLLGNLSKGKILIVSAPAGTGKTTLVRRLMDEFPDFVVQSISCTTRPPREGEIDGKDYVFLTEKAFEKRKASGDFLEYATVFNYQYGTLKERVEEQRSMGKHVALVIDTQGALKLQKEVQDALYIFIKPPAIEVLKERMENRKTETQEVMQQRLEWAQHELKQAKYYDYQIVNDDLETAYQVLRSIVIAEEHKI
ncbi:MAG: guanylate kinase [Simkaniaceae bacterium]